jgi:uncharacterized protein (TIGR03437 family)
VNTTPAKPGEIVVLYSTGFGPGNPPVPAGLVVAAPAGLANVVSILLNNLPTNVLFSGITGSGLDQFNIVVPAVADGDATLTAQVGGAQCRLG